MKGSDRTDVLATIENEGFDYCFVNYSDFKKVKDIEFHKLRKQYVAAHIALSEYLGCDD